MKCELEKITVNYEVFGQGRPLLLLPGWTLDARTYAAWFEGFLDDRAGWQRIYVDPPGHGLTPGAEWVTDLDQMLEVLLAFIDAVIPDQRFALFGHSLGAYLARAIIHRRTTSVDGLAMTVPVILPADAERSRPDHAVLVEDPQVMAALNAEESELFSYLVVRSRAMLEQIRAWPDLAETERSDYAYLQTIREDPAAYRCDFDVDALDEPFRKPALIITGRQDSSVGYADAWRLQENYPRATFVVLDRAGHFLEEKDDLIGPLLNEWLDRVEENLSD